MKRVRNEIAAVLDLEDADIPPGQNLIELGMHSLAMMRLITPLSSLAGVRIDYADLAGEPTLGAWTVLIQRLRAEHGAPSL